MRIGNSSSPNITAVSHIFIDSYMVPAGGEFVKTYLLLLRLSERGEVSLGELADRLALTETDVVRALRYWEREGLLALTEEEGELMSVSLIEPGRKENPLPAEKEPDLSSGGEKEKSGKRSYSAQQLIRLQQNQDFAQLLVAVERYLGRPLTSWDTDMYAYLYEELGFSGEVLEYLTEYCVELWEREDKKKDFHLIRYMEKVALNWHSQGALTLAAARQQTALFVRDSRLYGEIGKALGLKGRQLTEPETRQISVWTRDMEMSPDLILEACRQTIAAIHVPNFKYIERILTNWHQRGFKTLSEVRAYEATRSGEEKNRELPPSSPQKEEKGEKEKKKEGISSRETGQVDYNEILSRLEARRRMTEDKNNALNQRANGRN